MKTILTGTLTRLVAPDPDAIAEAFGKWAHDSEFLQLMDSDIAKPLNVKRMQQEMRDGYDKQRAGDISFVIQRLDNHQPIGETAFWNCLNQHRQTWVSVFIGERDLWSKGYGSDALKTMLEYGFQELNLHRVSLNTFTYNPRAIRAYERIGFVHEGIERGTLKRHGKRESTVFMGLLRSEWDKLQNGS